MDWGLWSLLPPVVSLIVALRTRHVVLALTAGCLSGLLPVAIANATADGLTATTLSIGVLDGFLDFVRKGIYGQVSKASNAQILVLIFMIGGFVGLLEKSGGTLAFAQSMTRRVRTPRQAQLATWAGGLAIFFSDVGNTLILGPLFRPVYDRLGISREKLAYIVDSTAAPVCVLIPFIGWGVYITGLLEGGSADLATDTAASLAAASGPLWDAEDGQLKGFQTLLALLPYQLYPLMTLLTVPVVILLGRDFGPMRHTKPVPHRAEDATETGLSAGSVLFALGLLLGAMVALMLYFTATEGELKGATIRVTIAAAYTVATAGAGLALWRSGVFTPSKSFTAFRDGMGRMMPMAIIIVFAWTLGDLCKEMGTGAFISQSVAGGLPPELLPLGVFIAGAAMSFATGTSFGTFAILIPIALPLIGDLDAPMLVTLAAVLSGGIFGDHTSPISDTTVLSSMGAGTPHADHVTTQLPYATIVGVSAAAAFTVAGFTESPIAIGLGLLLSLGGVTAAGRLSPPSRRAA